MAKARPSPLPSENQLLAKLPEADYRRLLPHLKPVDLPFDKVLYKARKPIDYVYFPTRGVLSALTMFENGDAIEVGTVGNEGMVGSTACLGLPTSPHQVVVQVGGAGLRMEAAVLVGIARSDGATRDLFIRYHAAFLAQVSQSVACNGRHSVSQRCCRWLLMTHDRVGSNEVPLTHEYLAIMLGVRRASVSLVLQPLQERGLIRSVRGNITILNRTDLEVASCECYQTCRDEYERLLG
jgi:CRP-like cAMP-binding protein